MGYRAGGAGAGEGVEDEVAGVGGNFKKLLGSKLEL